MPAIVGPPPPSPFVELFILKRLRERCLELFILKGLFAPKQGKIPNCLDLWILKGLAEASDEFIPAKSIL
jgi:hypothetical protein